MGTCFTGICGDDDAGATRGGDAAEFTSVAVLIVGVFGTFIDAAAWGDVRCAPVENEFVEAGPGVLVVVVAYPIPAIAATEVVVVLLVERLLLLVFTAEMIAGVEPNVYPPLEPTPSGFNIELNECCSLSEDVFERIEACGCSGSGLCAIDGLILA